MPTVKPPTIVLFVNDPELMHFSYLRYLENRIRETYSFEGTPLRLQVEARRPRKRERQVTEIARMRFISSKKPDRTRGIVLLHDDGTIQVHPSEELRDEMARLEEVALDRSAQRSGRGWASAFCPGCARPSASAGSSGASSARLGHTLSAPRPVDDVRLTRDEGGRVHLTLLGANRLQVDPDGLEPRRSAQAEAGQFLRSSTNCKAKRGRGANASWQRCSCCWSALMGPAARGPGDKGAFFLHDGDTVVFYGDSITEQQMYGRDIETYVRRRASRSCTSSSSTPAGAATGSRAAGAATSRLRLKRDVLPYNPTVVTVFLGMNDGGYTHYNEADVPDLRARA